MDISHKLKTLLKIGGLVFILIATGLIVIGLSFFSITPKQREKDICHNETFGEFIKVVECYKAEFGNYPSHDYFQDWLNKNGYENCGIGYLVGELPDDPDINFKKEIGVNSEYILCQWRGEWWTYYVAQNNKYYPSVWGYDSAWYNFGGTILLASILIVLGILPFKSQWTNK